MNYGRGRPCDFVLFKANKKWLWLALDRASRQVVALHVGDPGATGALGLWQALPDYYRQKATFYTDDWEAYKQIIPTAQHRFSKRKRHKSYRAFLLYFASTYFAFGSLRAVFF